MLDTDRLVASLKACAEPTRLRLLALCLERERSVTALAAIVRQSEPRVSRHLKLLCAAALLDRVREGVWVRYRAVGAGVEATLIRDVIAKWDAQEAVRRRDVARAAQEDARATDSPSRSASGETRLGRSLRAFLESSLSAADARRAPERGVVLLVGELRPELLEAAGHIGARVVALAESRAAAQRARGWTERANVDAELRVANLHRAPSVARSLAGLLPAAAAILDARKSADAAAPAALLRELRRALAAGGRLWFFARYDALERARGKVVEHPLARVRRLLAETGFDCERLQPIEADGEHVLAACARAREASAQVA
jgi:ArsR family transcriptional regulator